MTVGNRGLRTPVDALTRIRDSAIGQGARALRSLGIARSEREMRALAQPGKAVKVGVLTEAVEHMQDLGFPNGGARLRSVAGGSAGPPRRRRSDAGKPRPKSRTRPVRGDTT